ESFNRILVSRPKVQGYTPGIRVFEEKDDLLPFEEAKLYGHNAVHAVLAYLGALRGYKRMAEVKQDEVLMRIGRGAFLDEVGVALVRRHGKTGDALFTTDGFRNYAEDLLGRMTNPYLGDTVERIGRDPVRKLGADDRIFGAMTMALEAGIQPHNLALGAAAGLVFLLKHAERCGVPEQFRYGEVTGKYESSKVGDLLQWIWADRPSPRGAALIELTTAALCELRALHLL
ncbi:MAG: hypothetical protein N2255_05980, partial [Kiritimatiellae bacterium]|nr:hypothetical protein [Kiritimatiellia bacterium]